MKVKSFKKFLVSIALSAVLISSTATSAFAATAQLQQTETTTLSPEDVSDVPAVDDGDAQAAGSTYLTSQTGIQQVAASVNSLTVQWNPVTSAAKYAISISPFNSSSYKLLGYVANTRSKVKINKLKAGTAYNVKVTALKSSGKEISSRIAGCTTLYSNVTVKSSYANGNNYTFNMATVNPANSITGYKVIYQSYATNKAATKYFNTRYTFTLSMPGDTFYQVKIYPYIVLNNKRYVSSSPATRYVSTGVTLQKAGNTNTSMSVKWNKISGATNYSVYIKYPGNNSFKKVTTTAATSFKLTGMKKGSKYAIRVIANKKVGKQIWTSYGKTYSMSLV